MPRPVFVADSPKSTLTILPEVEGDVSLRAVQAATSPPPALLEEDTTFARLAEGSSSAGGAMSRLRLLRFCFSTNLTAKPLGKSLTTGRCRLRWRAAFQQAAAPQR